MNDTADIHDMTLQKKPSPQDEARFKALVAEGDRARLSLRVADAVIAYADALRIREDPLVSGRLGMCIAMANAPELDFRAAHELYRAVSNAAGVNDAERTLFWETYKRLRRRVCRVDVTANNIDALIYKGDNRRATRGSFFWTFVNQGIHKWRATLDGHADIEKTVECLGSEDVFVRFDFVPLSPPPPPPPTSKETTKTVIVRESAPPAPARAAPSVQEPAQPSGGRLAFGIGPVMVFGAAPSPSLGVSAMAQYRRSGYSVLGMAKGAWSLGGVENLPVDVFSASAFAGPCVQWRWLDGCALAGATLFERRVDPNLDYRADTVRQAIPAFGLGMGATYAINTALSARIFADATALTRDMVIDVASDTGAMVTVWQTQRFLFSLSASLVFGR
ncbi:hypothetical protein [Polyangium sp. y55x31]|uniref:hypothetical protein n=1 Tax=Polyangium sp. y55x31 TaxID=3042688 RepID=UPI002482AF78|nr:hypothetical protein [Polyangium sp. y55x31]MDI1480819.1 hypothetical protein [Polyangium sp. y55x31]